jgi:hypothetical protein
MEASTSSSSAQSATGIISGEFTTTETGSNSAALAALNSSFESGAAAAAEFAVGAEYTPGGDYSSQAEYSAAYEAAYQQAYSQAYSSAQASAQRESSSTVEVGGIGVIANVNAAGTSSFTADVARNETSSSNNGTGNGAAGASLSTSSFATQSNSTSASAFMQAFGASNLP